MSSTDRQKRGPRIRFPGRERRTQTLALLDYPDQNELIGKPITLAGPPPSTETRGTRRVVTTAVGVVVAMGSVIGGSVAFSSSGGPARSAPARDRLVMPALLDTSPARASLASTRPARRASGTTRPRPSLSPTAVSRASASPTAGSQAPVAPPNAPAEAPAVAVAYVIDQAWPNGFQGEVRVTNNTTQAISGWHIDLAVPQDRFNTWWNATGQVSNGILTMTQPSWSGPLEPGQTLHAYFNATGYKTSATVCSFNGITCARP